MERRTFLASTALAGAAILASDKAASAKMELNQAGKDAELKISFQEGIAPTKIDGKKDPSGALKDRLDWMEKNGVVGLEPGGGGLENRIEELKKVLEGRKIQISAICAGFRGAVVSQEAKERKTAKETMTVILQAAGELGSTGLIFVPAFNGQTFESTIGARFLLIDFLHEMAPIAEKAKCPLLLEPLNRGETWYVRQLSDAAKICEEVNSPFIKMMGDFYHMGKEEPCDYAAFLSARKHLRHVHLASRPNREQPGFPKDTDAGDDFKPGFAALKAIGYQNYCSYECGVSGNREEALVKSLEFIRKQWAEA